MRGGGAGPDTTAYLVPAPLPLWCGGLVRGGSAWGGFPPPRLWHGVGSGFLAVVPPAFFGSALGVWYTHPYDDNDDDDGGDDDHQAPRLAGEAPVLGCLVLGRGLFSCFRFWAFFGEAVDAQPWHCRQ